MCGNARSLQGIGCNLTTRLHRGPFSPLRNSLSRIQGYVIFPEDDLAYWTGQGFTGIYGSSVTGYAYLN
jgi:hypothetical protein